MILVIDAGNTDTKIAIVEIADQKIIKTSRFATKDILTDKNSFQYTIEALIKNTGTSLLTKLTGSVISSVVPKITQTIAKIIQDITAKKPLIIAQDIFNKLPLCIPAASRSQIGSDLLCDALSAYKVTNGGAAIIVDFGTALSFIAIDDKNNIAGVAIAPGIKTALYSLFLNTAQLPEISLDAPKTTLGVTTTLALRAGVIEGYYGLVSHLLTQMKCDLQKLGVSTKISTLATGGVTKVLDKITSLFDYVDVNYTILGAAAIYEYCK